MRLLTFLIIFQIFIQQSLLAETEAPQEFLLDNGLRLIIQKNSKAPIIVSHLWYRVGSADEKAGETGISHMLEHMLFKGSAQYPDGQYSNIIAKLGGEENAFTSRDFTGFYAKFAKEHLDTILALEADRLRAPLLNEKAFLSEREVVLEERILRSEDDPYAKANEYFYAQAYLTSPYRQPIIGWRQDIEKYNIKQVKDWFATWYSPNNATLVLVGDVDVDAAVALVKKHFSDIPKRPLRKGIPNQELQPIGKKIINLEVDTKNSLLYLAYPVPTLPSLLAEAISTPQEISQETFLEKGKVAFALAVLNEALAGSDSSRLPQSLVRQQAIAVYADSSYSADARLETLFILSAEPQPGQSLSTLEEALQQALQQIAEQGLSEEEFKRIRNRLKAKRIYEQDSVFYQGFTLAQYSTLGLPLASDSYFDQGIAQVTNQDLKEVIQQYFQERFLTVGQIIPAKPTN